MKVDGPLGRRFLRGLSLTAAMPLRVVEGASKFIEGASLYKTFTTALRAREMHSPFGGWRHHLSPASEGTITRAYGRVAYEETAFQNFIVPPHSGGKVVP